MLRNLSAGNLNANNITGQLATYLHNLHDNPLRLVSLLALIIVPIAALAWWYYSVVMSVNAVVPVQTTSQSSGSDISPDPQSSINPVTDAPAPASSHSTDSMDVHITSDSSKANVEVDGQSVPVPKNGSSHKVIENNDGKTTVDINVDSDGSGTNRTRSSTSIDLHSSSSSSVNIRNKESQ
ncbi:MAG: hypothetical protein ABWX90_02375 [Candidatus Saccharimonadales bacterium]